MPVIPHNPTENEPGATPLSKNWTPEVEEMMAKMANRKNRFTNPRQDTEFQLANRSSESTDLPLEEVSPPWDYLPSGLGRKLLTGGVGILAGPGRNAMFGNTGNLGKFLHKIPERVRVELFRNKNTKSLGSTQFYGPEKTKINIAPRILTNQPDLADTLAHEGLHAAYKRSNVDPYPPLGKIEAIYKDFVRRGVTGPTGVALPLTADDYLRQGHPRLLSLGEAIIEGMVSNMRKAGQLNPKLREIP